MKTQKHKKKKKRNLCFDVGAEVEGGGGCVYGKKVSCFKPYLPEIYLRNKTETSLYCISFIPYLACTSTWQTPWGRLQSPHRNQTTDSGLSIFRLTENLLVHRERRRPARELCVVTRTVVTERRVEREIPPTQQEGYWPNGTSFYDEFIILI